VTHLVKARRDANVRDAVQTGPPAGRSLTAGTLGQSWHIVKDTAYGFIADEALSRGAAIAFYTATSLAPVLLMVIAIAGLAFGKDAAQNAITGQLSGLMGDQTAAFYIGSSGTVSSYGAAGALIALLLWVYYSAQIFLLGAEFTKAYAKHRRY
jgi:uncharacterized BrkB/YihY/UPF0761 family membrane protein